MNTLKRYRVGHRELPASVVRRVVEQRAPIENDQPEPWELYDDGWDDWFYFDDMVGGGFLDATMSPPLPLRAKLYDFARVRAALAA